MYDFVITYYVCIINFNLPTMSFNEVHKILNRTQFGHSDRLRGLAGKRQTQTFYPGTQDPKIREIQPVLRRGGNKFFEQKR